MKYIPYGKQSIDQSDISAVVRVLKSSYLTQGPVVDAFEKALCRYTGAKYCVVVSSGTAALHLAVAALGLKKRCFGVTSPITFLASANALVYNGIQPLFADIDQQTVNMSPKALSNTIKKGTKVIIPVHFAGKTVDIKEIAAIAHRYNSFVVEDGAHAMGSHYPDGTRVGNCNYSDMTVFSFHPIKAITTGEGGAITTNNQYFYERIKNFRSHGMIRDRHLLRHKSWPWYYEMRELGFNYRLTDMQAALGLSQLKKIGSFIDRRKEIVEVYNKAFNGLKWLRPVSMNDKGSSCHLYVVRVQFNKLGFTRSEVMNRLAKVGIGSQVHYIPVYQHPFYRKNYGFKAGLCPEAEEYYAQCLSLPLFPEMKNTDVQRCIKAVKQLSKT